MRLKHILVGVFLVGLLVVGVGTSVVFAEFSTFSYGGERELDKNIAEASYNINIEEATAMINITPLNVSNDNVSIKTDFRVSPNIISLKILYPSVLAFPTWYHGMESTEENPTFVVGCNDGLFVRDPVSFIQYMDEVLNSLKERKIYSYSRNVEVVISANPEKVDMIQIGE